MSPPRSPLAAKVLEIEDSLNPRLPSRQSGEVILTAYDWEKLVSLASAVELVDAEEAAEKRALVEAIRGFVRLSDAMAHEWSQGDWRRVLSAVRDVTEGMRALVAEVNP